MRRKLRHVPRPSAAMLVAVTALFVAMGGVGYAAYSVPNNSVGTAQLRHSSVTHSKLRFNSVSFRDIQRAAVGTRRANLNQLQARVTGTCASGTAIGAVQNNGKVNCNAARPAEFGTTATKAVPGALTTVATLHLASGSNYMAFANPSATNSSGAPADVTCSLTVGPNKQTARARVASGGAESIPLQVAGPSGTADVSCSSTAPVSVTSAINALQTSSNG
ncbi:MAG: hypothetical protein M3016_00540 [Actinomycetota bacterium]|nr:hypothetical protein [Actinomycetota bacterium]